MTEDQATEIEQNFQFFAGVVSSHVPDHHGEFALLREREIVQFFPKIGDAMAAGFSRYADGLFSVQRVVSRPYDLGFLSYAEGERASC